MHSVWCECVCIPSGVSECVCVCVCVRACEGLMVQIVAWYMYVLFTNGKTNSQKITSNCIKN